MLVGGGWLLLEFFGLAQQSAGLSWHYVIYNAAIVAAVRAPIEVKSTLMEGKLLARKITDFLAKYELTMPTFITVAEEHAPGSIDRIAFRAYYADLQAKSPELREDLAYASAALPFGILPDMQILDRTFVDGGVWPTIHHSCRC